MNDFVKTRHSANPWCRITFNQTKLNTTSLHVKSDSIRIIGNGKD